MYWLDGQIKHTTPVELQELLFIIFAVLIWIIQIVNKVITGHYKKSLPGGCCLKEPTFVI